MPDSPSPSWERVMPKRLMVLFALVVALVAFAPAAHGAPRRTGSLTKHTLPPTADYPSRDYYLYVPASLPKFGERPLVVFLHGCTQSAPDAIRGVRWNELADERGVIVVYPEQHVPSGGSDFDGNSAR